LDTSITVEGAFWGWAIWLFYGLSYAGIVGFSAYQNSLNTLFSSFRYGLWANEDFRAMFWVLVD